MRSEKEIMDCVLDHARKTQDIRAVIRTDLLPVRKDAYTFYFVVKDIEKYDADVFKTCFGDRILLFRADKNYPDILKDTKAHLMVFRDGAAIAVHVMGRDAFLRRYTAEREHENVWIGDTYKKLLDKDGGLPIDDRLEEKQTIFDSVPSQEEYDGLCGEFWWVLKTLADYARRMQLAPAMFYLHTAVREPLLAMLRWHIRLRLGRPADLGVLDGNLEKLLEEDWFSLYKKTYADADYAHIREAVGAVVSLWRKAAEDVARRCGFSYPLKTQDDMLTLLRDLEARADG